MSKETWLNVAEVVDAYRIFPRIILIMALIGYVWFTLDTYEWIRGIYESTKDIPTSVAVYAGGTISALGGVVTLLINKYFSGGRNWTKDKQE